MNKARTKRETITMKKITCCIVGYLLVFLSICVFGTSSFSDELRLVPQPKKAQITSGSFFELNKNLTLVVPELQSDVVVEQLQSELEPLGFAIKRRIEVRENDFDLQLVHKAELPVPRLVLPNETTVNPSERYTLLVNQNGIYVKAGGKAGLIYAIQTIRQLLRANTRNGKMPELEIEDWPSLTYRCFMDDWTRGPSPKRPFIFRYIDLGTEFKHNMFTYYMESQFRWKKHPEIAPKEGAIDVEDLRAVVDYGNRRNVEILGNQQSFGHSYNTLKIPGYEEMGEAGYILSPAVPRVYQFLDDIYAEVLPVLPFEMFNVCCDEVYDLGKGPSKERVEQIGAVGVYLQHVQKVHELLKNRGKRMMMWGDIIMNHEDRIKEIPPDTVVLCWDYAPRDDFDAYILPFSQSGFEFFVCPGLSNWSRMLPDFKMSVKNTQNFVRDGVKYGALGMINTCWEDDGESLHGSNSYGIAWGGECAWSGSTTSIADFNRRIGAVLFGEKEDHFGSAIELLEQAQELGLIMNGRFWSNDFVPERNPSAIRKDAAKILSRVQPAIEHLEQVRKEATVNVDLLDSYLLGAKRMEWIATRMIDGLETAELYQAALESETTEQKMELLQQALDRVQTNRFRLNDLKDQFIAIWETESQPYALDWTLKKYGTFDHGFVQLEQRLQNAINLAEKGFEIPSSEEMGIPLPGEFLRNTKPAQFRQQPLFESLGDLQLVETPVDSQSKDSQLENSQLGGSQLGDSQSVETSGNSQPVVQRPLKDWLVADASYRIGMEVNAGSNTRTDYPFELDIPISGEFREKTVLKPARVFWIDDNQVREIPGQISFNLKHAGQNDTSVQQNGEREGVQHNEIEQKVNGKGEVGKNEIGQNEIAQNEIGTKVNGQKMVGRFCCIIPELKKGKSGYIYAYFGSQEEPQPELSNTFVRFSEEPISGESAKVGKTRPDLEKVWIENNHLRLLLCPEGGHVYRCELKEMNDRDMTFPGETDWFGFSDTSLENRHRRYTIHRLESGPAMIRYGFFSDEGELVKTITLCAGMNWFETVLMEPTGYYWDFDNPVHFAADSATPGTAIFSNGYFSPVAKSDEPIPLAQIFQDNTNWAAKYVAQDGQNLILGLATPGQTSRFGVGPGAGSGGVGIEHYPGCHYFVTYAGLTGQKPIRIMEQLSQTLDLKKQPRVVLFEMESK
ncbi:MAG: beta-N-acetylhexosaminidase [Thermoguttaceae bacterium]